MGLSGPSRHPEQVEDGMGRERGSSLKLSGQASLEDSVSPGGKGHSNLRNTSPSVSLGWQS